MKPLHLLLASAILFLCLNSNAQSLGLGGLDNKSTGFDFFGKGMNTYTIHQTGYYGRMAVSDNGVDHGHSNETYIDVDWKHWFGKGLGLGLKLDADWSGDHYNGVDNLSREWTIGPSLSYGKTVSNSFGVYGTVDLSFGQSKNIAKSSTFNLDSKDDIFGYGARVGLPYRFSEYTALTLELGYDYLKDKGTNFEEKRNTFGFDIFLQDYLRCQQIKCDHSANFKLSAHKYDQGNGFILYETEAGYYGGNSTETYSTLPNYHDKYSFNTAHFEVKGSYYIVNYLGLGGSLKASHSYDESDDGQNWFKGNSFEFDPEVYLHVPVDNGWRNLFAKGGLYLGSDNSKSSGGGGSTTQKSSTGGYNAGIGYYLFFSKQTALQTCIYYSSTTNKDKESDDESKRHGIGISVGLAHSFK